MNFFEGLEKLRQKPESYRKKIALFLSVVCAGLLIFFWSLTFSPAAKNVAELPEGEGYEDIASPLQNISSEFDRINDLLKKLREAFSS